MPKFVFTVYQASVLPKDSLSVKKENINLQKQFKKKIKFFIRKAKLPLRRAWLILKKVKKTRIGFSELELLYKKVSSLRDFPFLLRTLAVCLPVNALALMFLCLSVLFWCAVKLVPVQPGTHPTVSVHGWQQDQAHSFPPPTHTIQAPLGDSLNKRYYQLISGMEDCNYAKIY